MPTVPSTQSRKFPFPYQIRDTVREDCKPGVLPAFPSHSWTSTGTTVAKFPTRDRGAVYNPALIGRFPDIPRRLRAGPPLSRLYRCKIDNACAGPCRRWPSKFPRGPRAPIAHTVCYYRDGIGPAPAGYRRPYRDRIRFLCTIGIGDSPRLRTVLYIGSIRPKESIRPAVLSAHRAKCCNSPLKIHSNRADPIWTQLRGLSKGIEIGEYCRYCRICGPVRLGSSDFGPNSNLLPRTFWAEAS